MYSIDISPLSRCLVDVLIETSFLQNVQPVVRNPIQLWIIVRKLHRCLVFQILSVFCSIASFNLSAVVFSSSKQIRSA